MSLFTPSRSAASRLCALTGLAGSFAILTTPAVAFLTTPTASPAVRRDDAYALKTVYKAGDVEKYKIVLKISADTPMGPQSGTLRTEITETVNKVADDGVVTLALSFTTVEIEFSGQKQNLPLGSTVVNTYDKNGKFLKQEQKDTAQGPGAQIAQLLSLTRLSTLPEKPLKIGEDAKSEVPLSDDGKRKMVSTTTLVGKEPKSEETGVETLKFRNKAEITGLDPMMGDKISVDMTAFVNPDNGHFVKVDGKIDGAKLGPGGVAKITFTRTLVPGKKTN